MGTPSRRASSRASSGPTPRGSPPAQSFCAMTGLPKLTPVRSTPVGANSERRESGTGNERVAMDVEAQQPARPMPRVVDADARTLHDAHMGLAARRGDVEVIAQQVVPVETAIDAHRLAKQRRTLRAAFDVLHRLERAKQHGGGDP